MIVPWCVDVPQDRWPAANWLIVAAAVGVFVLQMAELPQGPPRSGAALGVTGTMILDGWGLRGLLGHMWLHGGLLHLVGNMWFLWIFGNAVCSKVGNLRYLLLYVLLGVAAGVTHLVFDGDRAIGASGAINGVVGMYLVLFYENSITCYWAPILIYWRQFTVSSFWMIGFWLFWDLFGAAEGSSGVAYFAHLGGFGAGFAVTMVMCQKGWITMERHEKSLWQWWQQRKAEPTESSLDTACAQLGLTAASAKPSPQEPPSPSTESVPRPSLNDRLVQQPSDGLLRVACSCGRTLKLSPQYAGKTVRCPQCRQEVVVGRDVPPRAKASAAPPAAGDGHIRFACTCGKRIKVPNRYGGRSGKCPQCGARVNIPHARG